ncbi:MAG: CpsD/CapB family tyrosine-protein kinase [Desulfobulbaceae bacterium]|jgi:Mrp family chromosome partitioning ATPase|nr:CpsD/CapB family tyrosine-protein kinase [Desulfobulbaceae bacterium]
MFAKLKSNTKNQYPGDAFLGRYAVKSRYAEAYRTLRVNLHFSMLEKEFHCLLVTSSLPSEGKSTTAANLGFAIAQSGKRVLLVDADMRKRGLSHAFKLKNAEGFSNLVGDVFGRPIEEGAIADYGLKDLLTLLRLQNKTCRINLKDRDNEADLVVESGRLVDIYWKNRPADQKLAHVLMAQNILTATEVQQALGHQEQSARRLGAILLGLGLVKEEELHRALSHQMMDAFHVTSAMRTAKFTVRAIDDDEIRPLIASAPNFDQLYQEYIADENAPSRIRDAIDTTICATEEKNLFVLPAGAMPPNPSELLASTRAGFLLGQLRRRFDLLIIDTPPVIPVSDALLLTAQADGVALVARAEKTNRKVIADALRRLNSAHANVLGLVLNGVDFSHNYHYKSYYEYGD